MLEIVPIRTLRLELNVIYYLSFNTKLNIASYTLANAVHKNPNRYEEASLIKFQMQSKLKYDNI